MRLAVKKVYKKGPRSNKWDHSEWDALPWDGQEKNAGPVHSSMRFTYVEGSILPCTPYATSEADGRSKSWIPLGDHKETSYKKELAEPFDHNIVQIENETLNV
jgi:hypothetical protein